MPLRYDPDVRLYIGEQTVVPADVFEETLKELVSGGADENEARRFLLDEEEWLDDNEQGPFCPTCGQAVLPGMRFCDARCEAAQPRP